MFLTFDVQRVFKISSMHNIVHSVSMIEKEKKGEILWFFTVYVHWGAYKPLIYNSQGKRSVIILHVFFY